MTVIGRRAEELLERLGRSVESQMQASRDQQAALAEIADRIAQLEREVSGLGAQMDPRFLRVETSLQVLGEDTRGSLRKLMKSFKLVATGSKAVTRDVARLFRRLAQMHVGLDMTRDERFFAVAGPLVRSERTMLGYDRLMTLWQAAENVAQLDDPAVEVGTFRGGSAALIADALRTFAGRAREVHVVDTFEGHLDETFTTLDPNAQRGKFRNVLYEDVRGFLGAIPGVHVHQGDARTVINGWPERRYSLVHVDVDLYRPTLDCLEYFAPRLVPSGIVVLDDFDSPTCPGVRQAMEEYLARDPHFQTWRLQVEQLVLIKH